MTTRPKSSEPSRYECQACGVRTLPSQLYSIQVNQDAVVRVLCPPCAADAIRGHKAEV